MGDFKAPNLSKEVHIWRCPISFALNLPRGEEIPPARMSSEKRRQEFRAGRRLVHFLLSLYLGPKRASEIKIISSPRGKPYLSSPELHFSLSHSRGRVALALSSLGPVGLDIEKIRPVRIEQLAQRVFTPGELRAMEALPMTGRHREDYFFWRWTCKEARVKLSGEGLSQSSLSSNKSVVVSYYEMGFYLSLAYDAEDPVERVRWLNIEKGPTDFSSRP